MHDFCHRYAGGSDTYATVAGSSVAGSSIAGSSAGSFVAHSERGQSGRTGDDQFVAKQFESRASQRVNTMSKVKAVS